MEKNVLVINIGSSSKKYSLYRGEVLLLEAHFERDKEAFALTFKWEDTHEISRDVFENSLNTFSLVIKERGLLGDGTLDVIGMRLVAPGTYFTEDRLVDKEFLSQLKRIASEDASHIAPVEEELAKIKKLFGKTTIVAISDSNFHTSIPAIAKEYSLPEDSIQKNDVHRFGYHGISLSGIVRELEGRPLGLEKRAIVCHLGSGASITALLDGKSIETSMGYSPLNGLVMSSRVGDIDVGAVLHLAKSTDIAILEEMMYKKSGFLALSGLSDDMRVLIDADKEGHAGATRAIETFAYTIRKYIGMYVSVLGGVDAIIFSGTIGERSFILRERICQHLEWLNVHLDSEKNTHAKSGDYINSNGSLGVCVIHSDEDFEIMKRVSALLG